MPWAAVALWLVLLTRAVAEVVKEAYDEFGNSLGQFVADSSPQPWTESLVISGLFFHPNASYYVVGEGSVEVEFWHPFDEEGGGKDMAAIHIDVAADFVENYQNQVGDESSTIQVKVVNKGWTGVVMDDMSCGEDSCPAVILAGTTQVAHRHEEGSVLVLNDFLARRATAKGIVLTDDFMRYYFYDFNFDGKWKAIPLVSDTRVLAYNKTTFSRMGINPPLPLGIEESEELTKWSWEDFVEVAINITKETGQPGWYFRGSWDEELKMSMMISRNWGASLYEEDDLGRKSCGLSDSFVQAMNTTIEPLLRGNYMSSLYRGSNDTDFSRWLGGAEPKEPPFCCADLEFERDSKVLVGMSIVPPVALNEWYSFNQTEIGEALVPGGFSFLGGSGLFLNNYATTAKQELGWSLVEAMIDRVTDYALVQRSPPPYESVLEEKPWVNTEWLVNIEQLKSAIPAQYPNPSFGEFGKLEDVKPFRLMWMEMLYKDVNASMAIKNLCKSIDAVIGTTCTEEDFSHPSCPICTNEDYVYDISECNPSNQRISITFNRAEDSECNGGVVLPSGTSIPCDHVEAMSKFGIIIMVISSLGGLMGIVAACLVFAWQKRDIIRFSQPGFCVVFSLGVAIMCLGNLFTIGENTKFTCFAHFCIIGLGFDLAFGALFSKVFRVWRIIENSTRVRSRPRRNLRQIRQTVMVVCTAIVLDLVLLTLWTALDPIQPNTDPIYPIEGNEAVSIEGGTCASKSTVWVNLFLVVKVLLIAWGVYLSWVTRKISRTLVEGPEISWSIYNFAVLTVVVIILGSAGINTEYWLLVQAIVVVVGSTTALILVLVPKLWAAMKGVEVDVSNLTDPNHRSLRRSTESMGLSATYYSGEACSMLCANCRSRWEMSTAPFPKPHLLHNMSAPKQAAYVPKPAASGAPKPAGLGHSQFPTSSFEEYSTRGWADPTGGQRGGGQDSGSVSSKMSCASATAAQAAARMAVAKAWRSDLPPMQSREVSWSDAHQDYSHYSSSVMREETKSGGLGREGGESATTPLKARIQGAFRRRWGHEDSVLRGEDYQQKDDGDGGNIGDKVLPRSSVDSVDNGKLRWLDWSGRGRRQVRAVEKEGNTPVAAMKVATPSSNPKGRGVSSSMNCGLDPNSFRQSLTTETSAEWAVLYCPTDSPTQREMGGVLGLQLFDSGRGAAAPGLRPAGIDSLVPGSSTSSPSSADVGPTSDQTPPVRPKSATADGRVFAAVKTKAATSAARAAAVTRAVMRAAQVEAEEDAAVSGIGLNGRVPSLTRAASITRAAIRAAKVEEEKEAAAVAGVHGEKVETTQGGRGRTFLMEGGGRNAVVNNGSSVGLVAGSALNRLAPLTPASSVAELSSASTVSSPTVARRLVPPLQAQGPGSRSPVTPTRSLTPVRQRVPAFSQISVDPSFESHESELNQSSEERDPFAVKGSQPPHSPGRPGTPGRHRVPAMSQISVDPSFESHDSELSQSLEEQDSFGASDRTRAWRYSRS